ncbi:RNA 2',3'-cyclic phosphodiesterase [Massilia sp. TSP1-1-2]|uniref:RNA 2',3'-cyclic phosphodiesterase n=1 Tax=Massilia sp. TSP1-1-2 TaxID=2804649 RepID=UPI003CFA5A41
MTPAPRLFIALLPDPAVRNHLAAWRDACSWPCSATPVKTARLHLTLHFLGDVPLTRLPELQVPCESFSLRLTHAALWPHGIAVLEPDTVPPALHALHANLQAALHAAGLAVDQRPYRPHVTLARRATGAALPDAARSVNWPIHAYHLMSSAPASDGSYTTLQMFG